MIEYRNFELDPETILSEDDGRSLSVGVPANEGESFFVVLESYIEHDDDHPWQEGVPIKKQPGHAKFYSLFGKKLRVIILEEGESLEEEKQVTLKIKESRAKEKPIKEKLERETPDKETHWPYV
jgi:hypothetical protein